MSCTGYVIGLFPSRKISRPATVMQTSPLLASLSPKYPVFLLGGVSGVSQALHYTPVCWRQKEILHE